MKNEMNKESREMMKQVILNSAIKVGEKEFINVPIELLVVPEEYQRATGNKISKIIASYDVNKLRIPIVSYRDNSLVVASSVSVSIVLSPIPLLGVFITLSKLTSSLWLFISLK